MRAAEAAEAIACDTGHELTDVFRRLTGNTPLADVPGDAIQKPLLGRLSWSRADDATARK